MPGASEQAHRDAATFFEVEFPALLAWNLDPEKGEPLSQPILYVTGRASGPHFEEPRKLFTSLVPHAEDLVLPGLDHLLQVRAPAVAASAIGDFLAGHPL